MKGNIWYICKYASPKKYFFGSRHFTFAKQWVSNGYDVTILTSNSNYKTDALPKFDSSSFFEIIDGIKTFWLNVNKPKTSSGLTRILSWLQFEFGVFSLRKKAIPKPDVIIVSSLSLLSVWSGVYYSWKYKAKFIFEVRDIWPKSAMVLGGYSKWNPLIFVLRLTELLGYSKADRIVGTMPNLVEHVQESLNSAKDKVVCVPQCYDKEFYQNEQEKLDSTYITQYLTHSNFVVCYAGTISNNNPLDQLLEVGRNLGNKITILVVGQGKFSSVLKERYADCPNILFPPTVKKSQIQHLLSFAHACYDSIDSEIGKYGLSRNKWIDYMMAAKPIICAFDGYQSMINEAGAGSFVKYGDNQGLQMEIESYMKDWDSVRQMGEAGRKWLLEERSDEKIADFYTTLF